MCRLCDPAIPVFKKGDRVEASALAYECHIFPLAWYKRPVFGTVTSEPRSPANVNVRRDGVTNSARYHASFWKLASR